MRKATRGADFMQDTLSTMWSLDSFVPGDRGTDPECRLYRRSQITEAVPHYMAQVLMENYDGLVVDQLLARISGAFQRTAKG